MDVEFSGPLFDGGWESGMVSLVQDIDSAVGEQALVAWRDALDDNIKINEGRYTSRLNVTNSATGVIVNDQNSVYGPWLEGTGSRNETTRFKGYASARTAIQALEGRLDQIVEPLVDRFAEEMNA